MTFKLDPGAVIGLGAAERETLGRLLEIYSSHAAKNELKNRYYEGKVSLGSVNLGIALPEGLARLEIGCAWGAKTVDVLASRSMFDGFVGMNGEDAEEIDKLAEDNALVSEYAKACRDELKYGCTFATLSADPDVGAKIRFHSPRTAAAEWDGDKGRLADGFAIMAMGRDANPGQQTPTLIYLYTDDAVWALARRGMRWTAERHPHRMRRPLMEPMIWSGTSDKPFGRSRIKEPIRRLIDSYVRTIANATIGLEFSTAPQKYLMGLTDEQFDQVVSQKFKQYVGNILAATSNPDTGEKPTFGQLPQGGINPHVEMIRILATQFSAATGLTVTETGVVNDANPTSSEAILAQSQTLISMAEQLNAGNGYALRTIALMALAIARGTTVEELPPEQSDIMAHFRNPAMPSVAVTADAAIKISSARPQFAQTDTFLEMIGFDKADIRRIRAQESRARGMAILSEVLGDENQQEGLE